MGSFIKIIIKKEQKHFYKKKLIKVYEILIGILKENYPRFKKTKFEIYETKLL